MAPFPLAPILMLFQDAENRSAFVIYVSIFAFLVFLGSIWWYFFNSKRKEILLHVPIYPFFDSAGRTAIGMVPPSNETNTSSLLAYLSNIDQLTTIEFEEMVGDALKRRGCSDIQKITHVGDKGWQITGIDKNGRLTYVRVIYNDMKIDRSIVQKFHTSKSTGKAHRAIIVTNSTFTEEAKEYAQEVNIELTNGIELNELCMSFIDESPHSDKATRPINRASMEGEVQQFIDHAMFSYPNPPSTFISETVPSIITFSPTQYYQFKLWQQFANSTRSWVWDMNYPNHLLVNNPTQNWDVVENRPQAVTMDLDPLTKQLEKDNLQYSIKPAPQIKKLSMVKEIVQQTTTIEKSYKDGNSQRRSQMCTADMADIDILTSTIFWGSSVDVKVKVGYDTTMELQLHEGKVSKILSQHHESIKGKTTIICQECQKLAAPAKYFRNLTYCPACGKVLCEKCGHMEGKHLCSDCREEIKADKKEKKKNPDALKKLKKSFLEWQMA